jgi:hypothetical protein
MEPLQARNTGSALGKPPREYQFKPGQSGNRKGRPKGAKTTATLLRELLDRKIEVRTGDTVRKISVREAMLTRFAEAALKGDTKSATFLLQRYDALEETGTSGACCTAGGTTNHRHLYRSEPQETKCKAMRTSEQALHDEILRTNFDAFLRRCLMTLNPGRPYQPNWHISALEYHLERVRQGNDKRLMINAPPRSLKSIVTSVAFPAFVLGHDPTKRSSLVFVRTRRKTCEYFRAILNSAWYKRAFPGTRVSRRIPNMRSSPGRISSGGIHRRNPDWSGWNIIVVDDPLGPPMPDRTLSAGT